jgi:aldose 1-epimerase
MITLARGGLELDIAPEIGGSLTRFTFDRRHVLRNVAPGMTGAQDACCYPLVPYANRIENGLLRFGGQEHRIKRNLGDHPHPLHGHGWRRTWRVESISHDSATIAYDHEPDDWPWAYTAEQFFALGDGTLSVRLALRNRGAQPMPCSLGLHPFFPRTAATRLTASVQGMWEANSTMIPTKRVQAASSVDLGRGVLVDKAPAIDNCFTDWRPPAQIQQADSGLAVALDGSPECRFFHLFVPAGEAYFAAEPVTAMPNAFNRPEPAAVTGLRTLEPGEEFSIGMQLAVRRR